MKVSDGDAICLTVRQTVRLTVVPGNTRARGFANDAARCIGDSDRNLAKILGFWRTNRRSPRQNAHKRTFDGEIGASIALNGYKPNLTPVAPA